MWSASSPRAANHRLGASGAEGSGCVAHAPCFPPGVPLVSSTAKSGTRHDVVPLSLPSCAASHEPVPAMVQFSPFVFVVSSGCRRGRRFQLALVQQITEPSKMTKAFQHRSFYRFSLLRCFASASRPGSGMRLGPSSALVPGHQPHWQTLGRRSFDSLPR